MTMFEKVVRIPRERVPVLIGKRGSAKSAIERRCSVSIRVDSGTGVVRVCDGGDAAAANNNSNDAQVPAAATAAATAAAADGRDGRYDDGGGNDDDVPYVLFAPIKAAEIVTAIGRGFAPDVAMTLLDEDNSLHVISLVEFAGKSRSNIARIKGRVIGERGRARRNMEQLSGTRISVYGKTVSIIGAGSRLKRAADAINAISGGSMHGTVYNRLETANRRQKRERMLLWENDGGGGSGGGRVPA